MIVLLKIDQPLTRELEGNFRPLDIFPSEEVSPFFGISYSLNEKTLLKFEKDTTYTDGFIDYEQSKSDYSFGIDYSITENFVLDFSYERGNYSSLKFLYKNNPKTNYKNTNINRQKLTKQTISTLN